MAGLALAEEAKATTPKVEAHVETKTA